MFSELKMALTSAHHFDSGAFCWWSLCGVELFCGTGRAGGEPGELSSEESMMRSFCASFSSLRAKMGFKTFCPPVDHRSYTLSYQPSEAGDWGGVCFAGDEIGLVWSLESLFACLPLFTRVLSEDAESSSSLSDNRLVFPLFQCKKNQMHYLIADSYLEET